MRSLTLFLVLALTSVASSDVAVSEVLYIQAGETTELRCPMDSIYKCQWYSAQKQQMEG